MSILSDHEEICDLMDEWIAVGEVRRYGKDAFDPIDLLSSLYDETFTISDIEAILNSNESIKGKVKYVLLGKINAFRAALTFDGMIEYFYLLPGTTKTKLDAWRNW